MLAGAGSGSALLWRAYGTPSFTTAAATAAPVADKPVELPDLQALQRQVAGSMQSTEKLLTAQQADLGRGALAYAKGLVSGSKTALRRKGVGGR
jgi:hypothetical protein